MEMQCFKPRYIVVQIFLPWSSYFFFTRIANRNEEESVQAFWNTQNSISEREWLVEVDTFWNSLSRIPCYLSMCSIISPSAGTVTWRNDLWLVNRVMIGLVCFILDLASHLHADKNGLFSQRLSFSLVCLKEQGEKSFHTRVLKQWI